MEGEFVKKCLLMLPKRCVQRRPIYLVQGVFQNPQLHEGLKKWETICISICKNPPKLSYFSLALDKSNDVRDSAQLLIFIIFIHGMNDYFEVTEELAVLQSIKGTTIGKDIYEKFCQTVNSLEQDWAKLASVTTDGAPSMLGSKKGVIAHINQDPIATHRLIHQQVLCSKSLKWDSVKKTVVSCVNFITSYALNHRQFQEFLSELNVACEDVPYHTEVCWLSQGRVLKHFYDLLPQITSFLLSKNKEVPELNNEEWKWHLAFLTDVTELLNSFNVQLQRKGELICDMQSHVKAFKVKLGLLIKQVKEESFYHLPTTQNLLVEKSFGCIPK
ncbi:general transcription factor II-I repeat domain-containing protein 2-like [Nycticebus coucang]|uniref:general transcription factor II-I repeat domain-containing protein 2-like n=1 Tax=Nycticebus coucang TaxID=9470 RepID=UPI00234D641D|nr:general transcription factor II-I repeat domain-containing protein 2-like [Nycticebus coucang]XP_053453287.1 general transcription factor II-I repeat domain-containing protein 2-like [Nycticebus coucang]XP_053453288.1 general transcription factor II-I repeat domain-containing protein 2-like [Nycticebus coucang]XP_053453289.1 general transcription factor II-I repeat domain-containing protein 2-like [Nycticebus coucang]XP_053453290.1 general transcription factor II-I repeat domain-containing p